MATLFWSGDRRDSTNTRAARARRLRVLRFEDRDEPIERIRALTGGLGLRAAAVGLLVSWASVALAVVGTAAVPSDATQLLALAAAGAVVALVVARAAHALAPEAIESAGAVARLGGVAALSLALARVAIALSVPYLAPVTLLAAVVTIAHGPALAGLVAGLVAAASGLALGVEGGAARGVEHAAALTLASVVVAVRCRRITDRASIFRAGFAGAAVLAITIAAARLATSGAPLLARARIGELYDLVYALLSGGLFGFVLFEILPTVERAFGTLTDLRLQGLADLNSPILKRMNLEAPGTFHHSQVVARLAESAAEAIGANGLLARVGAYYHDLGKIAKPAYFTENNRESGAKHGALSPTLSALVIHAHVKDGVELAREIGLPERIIDFIPEHHGTTACEYFYRQAAKEAQERGETVDKEIFRYPGPRPRSKETAILLICDTVEAVARSTGEPTPARVQAIVREVILDKLIDHQFDDAPITLGDLRGVEEAIVRVLGGIYHVRVKYPEKPAPTSVTDSRVEKRVRDADALSLDSPRSARLAQDERAEGGARERSAPANGGYDPPMTW